VSADFTASLREKILTDPDFVSAVFGGRRPGTEPPWLRVTIRPVLLRGQRHLQFQYFDLVHGTTRNCGEPEAAAALDEVLGMPFRHYYVRSRIRGLQVQVTRKGKALIREQPVADDAQPASLEHDRQKKRLLDPARESAFFGALGMLTDAGRIKPTMQAKYRQVSEFLRLLDARVEAPAPDSETLRVVDFGCGNAYLTFAVRHFLATVRGFRVAISGVDTDALAVERGRALCRELGWEDLSFEVSSIEGYAADPPPQIVLALHACDTGTDAAIARAITWKSRLVFVVPCCHHHLQAQLDRRKISGALRPVLHFGLLKERLGDVLTDTFRALLLGIAGYRVETVQFVSPDHTTKNLMIVAERNGRPGDADLVRQYMQLKEEVKVVPYLETLVAHDLGPALDQAGTERLRPAEAVRPERAAP
jgi:SAM-dependent methyltransferase